MSDEQKTQLRLEIAHVLFMDIVGYSKLLIDEQSEALQELNQIVRNTEAARTAEAAGQLIILPTGDGMALVFTGSVEDPVECALQLSQRLRAQPSLPVRMGIHSGPVHHVADVNQRENIAGAGINIAQRVMDCGDAGHILLSKRVADDLAQYRRWQPYLHDLGDFEVKHGVVVSVVNLYADVVGNPEPPAKLKHGKRLRPPAAASERAKRSPNLVTLLIIGFMLFTIAGLAIIFAPAILKQTRVRGTTTPAPAASVAPSAASILEKSVAVLPFENMSRDPDNAFFTDGVQDQILTALAKVADLKVISRTSVMQYKTGTPRNTREIGQQLGVAHLLEGSVQRAGNKVRVNAQLIDARSDAHEWADNYDRPVDDVFAIQSEIAKAIADQLQAKLSPNEKTAIEERPTANIAAFDEYSRAKTLLLTTGFSVAHTTNFLQAVDNLNSAIARDPSFFEAYCQLVYANDSLYALGTDHTAARLAQAETALQGAAHLRPDAAEAHLARASHLYFALRDYKGAFAELEIARRGLANDPRIYELTGYILRRQGKHEEGLRDLKRAVELDPRNPFTLAQLAISYQFLRRWPDMATVLDRALAITPDDIETRMQRGLVDLYWKADPQPLHQAVERVRAEQPASIAHAADNWFLGALAERDWAGAKQALAALGDEPFWGDGAVLLGRHFGDGLLARAMHDDAKVTEAFAAARLEQEQIVEKQKDYGPALCVLGLIDSGLGKKEVALEEGRRAMELMPVEKDSINGQRMQIYFAIIAAWVGEKDLALQQLALAGPTPGASLIATYGPLKLLPFWDPLRGDPRFEKIVADLAPKL
jgi:TolB-like protein/class 3 adenylate cyclase/Flp pilus assembly protein TadD